MESSRPTWLDEPCPSWCLREHDEDDHPEDREHRGEPVDLAVVATGEDAVPVTDALAPLDLIVQLHRRVGAPVEWVSIEPAEARQPRLALTRGSARALATALRRVEGHPGPGSLVEIPDDLSSG
ncbi:DUF6907 domain-containing protein [Nocardioides sp. L-11A]|uniref:DUF6907 domain-containing protein n=1 Tax=Nocardioides sp. L-11A TaxID=3043848 RepID=UPI00249BBFEB|nr:hypothetical protein QJ852_05940 [Nocardioides sp. L-11A]